MKDEYNIFLALLSEVEKDTIPSRRYRRFNNLIKIFPNEWKQLALEKMQKI